MNFSLKLACLMLSACAVMFPIALAGQEPAPASVPKRDVPKAALNEQLKSGEALFAQNCSLCHIPSAQKKRLGIQGSVLQGMFNADTDEAGLRQFILQGVPKQMPGFRYDLDPKQIDDLIAYLKAGAELKGPGTAN